MNSTEFIASSIVGTTAMAAIVQRCKVTPDRVHSHPARFMRPPYLISGTGFFVARVAKTRIGLGQSPLIELVGRGRIQG